MHVVPTVGLRGWDRAYVPFVRVLVVGAGGMSAVVHPFPSLYDCCITLGMWHRGELLCSCGSWCGFPGPGFGLSSGVELWC